MELFFDPSLTQNITQCQLNEQEAKHLSRVLRKKVGDTVFVTNGAGLMARSTISILDKQQCLLQIESFSQEKKPQVEVHLWLGIMHQSDRMEFAIEKAVELGVSSIHLIRTDFCQHKGNLKRNRLETKIIAAIKQSQRSFLPELSEMADLSQCFDKLKLITANSIAIFGHEVDPITQQRTSIYDLLKKMDATSPSSLHVFIGPEGGFSPNEVAQFEKERVIPIQLGPKRLRAETAAISALAIIEAWQAS